MVVFSCCSALLSGQEEQERRYELRDIHVRTRNVFSDQEAEDNLFYRLANLLHFTTDPTVVKREIWFTPGEMVTTGQVEELERNLRASRLFGEVDATLMKVGEGEEREADLQVSSRDRFSLIVGAGVSFFGGTSKVNAGLGELNLFGSGKRIIGEYRKAGDEQVGQLRYTDPQLLGSWYRLAMVAGNTEEGPFLEFDMRRPFKHLADPLSHGISVSLREQEIDYFARGDTVAEVPEQTAGARLFLARSQGPPDRRSTIGVELRGSHSVFSAASGPDAAFVRVPEDVIEAQLGPFFSYDYISSFREETGLDSLDFVEDLQLGAGCSLRWALVDRDEDSSKPELQQLVELGVHGALAPLPRTYITAQARGSLRWHEGHSQGWQAATALHAYNLSLPYQTLAVSLTFDAAAERQGLAPQVTLGEDNGLRGYPAREFSGTRFLRLNVEDRVHTNLEFLSLRFGLAAFFDAGWVHNSRQGLSMDDAITSAGIGLRIGSSHLVGKRILRIDLAWPLGNVQGEDFDLSLSVASGQVFGFFGNKAELGREFGF